MLARVSRYVVKSDPSSEASTGAKKPELSFRKTMFILFGLVGVCIYASIYEPLAHATKINLENIYAPAKIHGIMREGLVLLALYFSSIIQKRDL